MIFIIALVYCLLYLPNLTHFVFGGDSAELTTAFSIFGISHPPGYPLFTLLNNIWIRLIPFINNIYLKISFLNSIFILLSVIFVYFIFRLLIKDKFFSFFSSIFFLILFPIWLYGLIPEVFSFSLFLFSGQIYSLLCLYFKNKNQNYYKNIFLIFLGLSIAHHHFVVFLLPGYFYLILKTPQLKKLFFKNYQKNLLIVLFTGFIFYIYPIIVSFLDTPLDIENAKTISGLIRLITRASYGSFKAYSWVSSDILNRLYDFFSSIIFLIHDFRPLGIMFIIFGFIVLKKEDNQLFKFFLINLISISFFFFYANFYLNNQFGVATYERFLIFIYLILIFPFGIGLKYLLKIWQNSINKFLTNQLLKKITFNFFYLFLIFYYLSIFRTNYQTIKLVKNFNIFNQFGQDLLLTPEKNSILILTSDNSSFISQNLYYLKNLRNDLYLITPAYIDRIHLQKRGNLKKLYFPKNTEESEKIWKDFYQTNYKNGVKIFSEKPDSIGYWTPYGLLWKYYPNKNDQIKELIKIKKINVELWKNYQYPKLNQYSENILFTKDIQLFYNRQLWALINFYMILNEFNLANFYADQFFSLLRNDYQFLLTYINLNVSQQRCQANLKIAIDVFSRMKIKKSIDYKPLLNYYLVCEKNKQKYQTILDNYNKLKLEEEILLKKL